MPDLDAVLTLGRNLGGVIAAVFYLSLVLWTWKDARRRIADPILVATAVVASIVLPIIGVFVYMLLRPPEYLADVRERELEIRAIERALGRQERCPSCRSFIEQDYLTCPICLTKLREACDGCDRPIDPRWQMCPFCETEARTRRTPAGEPPRRARRSRKAGDAPAKARPSAKSTKGKGKGTSGGSESTNRMITIEDDVRITQAQPIADTVVLEPLGSPQPPAPIQH